MSGWGSNDTDDNSTKDKEEDIDFPINDEANKYKDKVLEDIQTKLDVFTHKDTLPKKGIMLPYTLKWDLISFSDTFQAPNINKYSRKGSPNMHIYHFHSLIENVIDNGALMIRSFVGSLKALSSTGFESYQLHSSTCGIT